MRWGAPYKGSKNQIAEWVVKQFPRRKNFYDLFAGGCAVTHCAAARRKFDNFTVNDISDAPSLFVDAVKGKFKDEKRWISRDDFFELKDSEPYVRYCWSFGNNGESYLYSREVELWKKALHYARALGDFSLLREFGIETDDASRRWIQKNEAECKKKYIDWAARHFGFSPEEVAEWERLSKAGVFENLIPGSVGLGQLAGRLPFLKGSAAAGGARSEQLERLQSLESLERLQRLQSLQRLQRSYCDVKIEADSVIYCDIPYKGTSGYNGQGFDYEAFYDWAERQSEPCYISEYWMPPERFECAAEIKKTVALQSGRQKSAVEKIFVPKTQLGRWPDLIPQKEVQRNLFDF